MIGGVRLRLDADSSGLPLLARAVSVGCVSEKLVVSDGDDREAFAPMSGDEDREGRSMLPLLSTRGDLDVIGDAMTPSCAYNDDRICEPVRASFTA